MNWNDYEALWKRQELPRGEAADLSYLYATFETKRGKLRGAIQGRDLAEAGAGLVVAAAYAFYWWQVGREGWPMAFALALILGVTGFFMRERFRARRLRLAAEAPLLAKVEADLAELRHQCDLARTVGAWYLAPCTGAIAIHMAVIIQRSPAWSPLRQPLIVFGFGAFFAIMIWFGWLINRHALRKQLEPRLVELEKLHRDLLTAE